jgi:hypothetical protein
MLHEKSCRENQNTHFILNNASPLPPKIRAIYGDTVEKYGGARGHRWCNMTHLNYMLGNYGYRYTQNM